MWIEGTNTVHKLITLLFGFRVSKSLIGRLADMLVSIRGRGTGRGVTLRL
jgi:hypothetical protein